jgi:penicillin amidase
VYKKFPLLSRVLVFLVLPLVIAACVFIHSGRQSLEIDQAQQLQGDTRADVFVQFDKNGIAIVHAKYDTDAFYALGFSHAKDRLWQMEVDRRMASGRLSEILGESALSSDKFMRTMGLKRNAEKIASKLGDREKQAIDAYVKGVNFGISALKKLPLEFEYFQYQPEPWTAVDSLLKLQLVTLQMSSNLSEELLNSLVFSHFDSDKLAELYSPSLVEHLTSERKPADVGAGDLISYLPDAFAYPKQYVGSNAWAVSAKHSASKKPILANDPHLDNTLPSVFYLAHLKGDRLDVTGATFPGLPVVVSGRNLNVAWGITSMTADTQDLYVVRFNPANNNQYMLDGKYRDITSFQERIFIRSDAYKAEKPPYVFNVRRTHHGPVISDVVDAPGSTLTLRWTGDDEDGGTLASLLNINYADNADEFVKGLSQYVAPILNIVFSDTAGNIGSIAPGKYPVRNERHGLLPSPGWDSQYDWHSWIPSHEWPRVLNPASGVVIAANNNVLSKGYPYYISRSWAPDFRADRIHTLLEQRIKATQGHVTVEDFQVIQTDLKHPMAALFQQFAERMPPQSDSLQIKELLLRWNGEMTGDSPAAALVSAWLAHLNKLVFEDDIKRTGLPEQVFGGLTNQLNYSVLAAILQGQESALCAYHYENTTRNCAEVIDLALARAVRELQRQLGDESEDWAWSSLASAHYSHFPFSGSRFTGIGDAADNKIMASLYHRTLPGKSAGESVNSMGVSFGTTTRFYQMYGASFRQVIDLGNKGHERFILSTGQSGNIFSPHFDDMLTLFNAGQSVQIDTAPAEYSIRITSKLGGK